MQHHYHTYYEGLDANGNVIFNGNGSFSTEPGAADGRNVFEHSEHLLKTSQDKNPLVVRVVIKNLVKL